MKLFILSIFFLCSNLFAVNFDNIKEGDSLVFTKKTKCRINPEGFQFTSDLLVSLSPEKMVNEGTSGTIIDFDNVDISMFTDFGYKTIFILLDDEYCHNIDCIVSFTQRGEENAKEFKMLKMID